MNKSAIVIQVIAIAILAGLSIGLWRVRGHLAFVRAQIQQQEMAVNRAFETVDGHLKSVTDQVTQQSMLINQALGKILPYSLPANVDAQIKAIQDQLTSESTSPTSSAAIKQLRADLASVVAGLPPWAQEELLPRLVPMRWDIEALWLLASQPSNGLEQLSEHASTVDYLLSNKPIGSSDIIEKNLKDRAQETAETIANAERAAAVGRANRAIKDEKDIETAARLISVYDDPESKKLTASLNGLILAHSIRDALSGVQDDFSEYRSIQDATLKEYALARTSEALMDLKLRILSAPVADPTLDKSVTALSTSLATAVATAKKEHLKVEAGRLKHYQVWALQRIKQLRRYNTIEGIELAKIPGQLDRVSPISQLHRDAVQRARHIYCREMIDLLAPIDQGLLDLAVSGWFRKVYEEKFMALADNKEKLLVVTSFAMTPKTSIEEVQ
jgi:hypothetical protein